jgi:sugar O-acyltransferase (sialic acid O-acetyltransferase NeuD family)
VLDKNLILVGYSGHGLVLADTAIENNFNIIGYSEKFISKSNPLNLEYLGCEADESFKGWYLKADYIIGIGDNDLREKIYNLLIQKDKKTITLINPSSSISNHSEIGNGVFINRNVSINAFASIGNNVILNTGCIIEHECNIADHVHIAPGAVLAGNVIVGERTFIGANSIVKQGIKIGKDVVVGAGSVVLTDIPDGKRIVGNPNRFI